MISCVQYLEVAILQLPQLRLKELHPLGAKKGILFQARPGDSGRIDALLILPKSQSTDQCTPMAGWWYTYPSEKYEIKTSGII